jgi:cytochrome c553
MTASRRATRSGPSAAALLVAAALSINGAQAAGDASAGQARSRGCQTCHGANGIASMPGVPSLAAQNEQYLIKVLGDYKTGARKDDMMSLVAQRLSDDDVANLAAYYAGLGAGASPQPAPPAQ